MLQRFVGYVEATIGYILFVMTVGTYVIFWWHEKRKEKKRQAAESQIST